MIMGLFGTKKNGSEGFPFEIASPADGKVTEMKNIPDPVFSAGVLGPCVGVEPANGAVKAPFDGKITQVADTFHAVGIESTCGVEMLLHLGVDTVSLGGKGFDCHVHTGDKVKKGDPLIDMDTETVKNAGFSTVVISVVTNADDFGGLEFTSDNTVNAGDRLITVSKK